MSRGFVLLGINTEEDRIRFAYTTALSIKASDPNASICLVVDTDQELSKIYETAFDFVTELPFGNVAHKDGFHGANIWQLVHASPYDETIYLDYDTIFVNVDVDLLWEQFEHYDIAIPANAKSFRNVNIDKRRLFEFELKYDFPTNHNSFIYFKKDTELAQQWFKMADPIFQNWRDVYNYTMDDMKPLSFDKNVICNIITYLLDCQNEIRVDLNNFYDFDTQSQHLWNKDVPEHWTDLLNYWFPENRQLIIENSIIGSGIIHYRDFKFITDEINDRYRTKIDIDRRREATS